MVYFNKENNKKDSLFSKKLAMVSSPFIASSPEFKLFYCIEKLIQS
jgi:hypothetical protein